MRENLKDIYRILSQDETLLRLLYYRPSNQADDPLSDSKQNILDMPDNDKWAIIEDRIKTTIKTDDLDKTPKCRLMFYSGNRKPSNNYQVSSQEIIFDILVHFDFENVDFRLAWICDRINELIFDERITGIKKISFEGGNPIHVPNEYVGYKLAYEIASVN